MIRARLKGHPHKITEGKGGWNQRLPCPSLPGILSNNCTQSSQLPLPLLAGLL